MRIHLKTLGCRLNEAELESWARDFHARGHDMTQQIEHAELVIINTCAVTQEAVKKSRKQLRKAQRKNPHAKLVVSGCYASLSPDETLTIDGVDLVVANSDKSQLVDIVLQKLNVSTPSENVLITDTNPLLFSGRQRAFIKVQDGCRYRCTYCIVTLARGEEKSRSIKEIVREINLLCAQNIKEIVITGVHLGGYGSDINSNLTELIEQILQQTKVPRIRMGSLEPWELNDDFWQLFKNPRLMPHLHLPLQSGADSVLRRMSRRCKTIEFTQLIQKARSITPSFNITTDIIVGFPGETQEEWQTSVDFIKTLNFGHIHIFAFSPREGTKAATLNNNVSRETKRERSQILHDIATTMKINHLEKMLNQTVEVLFEGNEQPQNNGRTTWSGYTPNFHRICVNTHKKALTNTIQKVKIKAISEHGELIGSLL